MTISLSRQVSELWSLLRGLPVQLAFGVTKWNVCRVSTPGTFTSWTSALKMCHSATSFCYRCLIIVKQRFKRSTFVGKRQTKASPSNPSYHNYHIRTAGSYGGRWSPSLPSQRPPLADPWEGHSLLCGARLHLRRPFTSALGRLGAVLALQLSF